MRNSDTFDGSFSTASISSRVQCGSVVALSGKLRRPPVDSAAAVEFSGERLRRGRPGIAEDVASSGGLCGGVVVLSRAVAASHGKWGGDGFLPWAVAAVSSSGQYEGSGVSGGAVRRRCRPYPGSGGVLPRPLAAFSSSSGQCYIVCGGR